MQATTIESFLDANCPELNAVARNNLRSWLNGLVAGAPISSNLPSHPLPFQRWYRFKEAFSPLMVAECLSFLGFWPTSCLDCFGGSGTTALTCQFLGIEPTTVEVNPFLADLIEAKLTKYDCEGLVADYAAVIGRVASMTTDLDISQAAWPATMVEPGVKGRWIFPKDTFQRIMALRSAIAAVDDPTNQRLMRVVLGSTLIGLSNVIISGKGRRYRSNWQRSQKTPKEALQAFQEAFQAALCDIAAHGSRQCETYTLLRGDARVQVANAGQTDVALFSPPYPNSFDYTDISNIQLWVLGYLDSKAANSTLRTRTLRSHVQIARDMSWEGLESPKLRQTVANLRAKRSELWDQNIPDMVGAYFSDLDRVLRGIRGRLNPDGAVLMTVGDSRYADVHVDVGDILSELAAGAGYICEAVTPLRAMKTSAQQGGAATLSEDLVRFRPA